MGQQEIINLLEKKDEWMTARELSEELKSSLNLIYARLKVLLRFGEILCKEESTNYRYRTLKKYKAK